MVQENELRCLAMGLIVEVADLHQVVKADRQSQMMEYHQILQ